MLENHIETLRNYLVNRNYSPKSIRNYLVTIQKFLNDTNKEPKDITMQDFEIEVTKMLTSRNKGKNSKGTPKPYSTNSLTSKYMALKVYINFLNEQIHHTYTDETHHLKYNKKTFLHPPPHVLPDKEALTKEEISRIFEFAKTNKRDYAILNTLFFSTQRKTTIQMLNLEDVNFNTQMIEYKHGLKGKMGEKKPHYNYPIDAFPSLIDYVKNGREKPQPHHENALFLNGLGLRICSDTINAIVKKYVVMAKITKHCTPHSFRRSAITIMDSNGMTRDAIMKITGHRQIDTLDTYLKPDATECNKKSHIALSLNTTTQTPEVNSQPKPITPPEKEKKPQPQPQDSYIAKLNTTQEEIRLLELQIEYLKLKQQHQNEGNNTFYG